VQAIQDHETVINIIDTVVAEIEKCSFSALVVWQEGCFAYKKNHTPVVLMVVFLGGKTMENLI